jgi:hypothetical protein
MQTAPGVVRWKAAAEPESAAALLLLRGSSGSQLRLIIMTRDEEMLEKLEQATEGLLFMSEVDNPFEIVNWGGMDEIAFDYLRRQAGTAPDAPVQIVSPEKFFAVAMSEPKWKGEQELATARRYQALIRLLKENLDDLKVYRVGTINIAVYIVGRAATGNWVGLSTRVVET